MSFCEIIMVMNSGKRLPQKVLNPNLGKIKDSNHRKTHQLLLKKKKLSKQEITRRTKLSITTARE